MSGECIESGPNSPKWPFWRVLEFDKLANFRRVLEFDKFAGEWSLLINYSLKLSALYIKANEEMARFLVQPRNILAEPRLKNTVLVVKGDGS
jgi:hypothetical protein